MSKYAEHTDVPSDRSRAEIERTLTRYGAKSFMYGWDVDKAVIQFDTGERRIRFELHMPDRNDRKVTHTEKGKLRARNVQEKEYEQRIKQRWRALALVIKAKLEAVESGISLFEDEFMAHIVLPNGETVGQWMRPQIATAYEQKKMPPLIAIAAPKTKK